MKGFFASAVDMVPMVPYTPLIVKEINATPTREPPMNATAAKKTQRVPQGGYGRNDGRIFTRSQVTAAVSRYARRHGYYARTVRDVTSLFREAMAEAN